MSQLVRFDPATTGKSGIGFVNVRQLKNFHCQIWSNRPIVSTTKLLQQRVLTHGFSAF